MTQRRSGLSRREVLSAGAAVSLAGAALGPAGAQAAAKAPVDRMLLQVAAAVAVFPVSVETHEAQSAPARLRVSRLRRAVSRCSDERVAQAERGARLLLDRGLAGAKTKRLLTELGRLAAGGKGRDLTDLRAVVAVAGATLVDSVDPNDDLVPTIWLRGLAIMHERGVAPTVRAAA